MVPTSLRIKANFLKSILRGPFRLLPYVAIPGNTTSHAQVDVAIQHTLLLAIHNIACLSALLDIHRIVLLTLVPPREQTWFSILN
jgi:hypothetical protein